MAESILYRVATEILKTLGSEALQEIGLVWGVKDELHKLANTVFTIRAVLLDAEEKLATNHEVRDWLEKLKDAVHDAADLLDDFSTELLRRQAMTHNKRAKKVRVFFSSSNQLAFSLKMAHQVKAIRESLDAIAADRTKFHFIERPVEPRVMMKSEREETHSFVRENVVIGRVDDRKAIVELLLDSNVQENVSINSIVGIGGLGKTTLAQLVYNDEKVQKHFELKMWVCVSDVFDVKFIAKKIIESVSRKELENLQMDQVQNHLRKEIDGKKYLLVLDDVWNEDRERWLKLKDLLMGGARGSKILVTTRAQLVATITGSISSYILKGLPKDESWSLFKQVAFKQGKEPENPRLVAIGKEIVKKCAGVPIAIRTLGSLLYSKDTDTEWLNFLNNDMSKLAHEESVIRPILKLSYDYLPSYLKQCFAYCSLYLKDYEIDKQELIQLWIAHGFIQSMNENQHLEDVGDLYFMDLLRRSFFQGVKEDELGNIISCKMHDLIHDLAQLVARNESCVANLDARNVAKRIRHVSFDSPIGSSWTIPSCLLRAKKIQTLLLPVQVEFQGGWDILNYETIVSNFRRLRVLDLHKLGIKKVSECISKLKHLRYLDISRNRGIESLPNSITKLQNLQTLKLSGCERLKELPRDVRKLVNLRHLELDQCCILSHMPCGLGQLTSLRTLTHFIVGCGDRSMCGLSELKGLNNLPGNLTIEGIGGVSKSNSNKATVTEEFQAAEEAVSYYLKGKEYLHSLKLYWGSIQAIVREDDNEDELMLEGLQPHTNLKQLVIEWYMGVSLPSWMMVNIGFSLPNLVHLTLSYCRRCQRLPQLGQLPSLQVLSLKWMDSVEYIDDDNDCSEVEAVGGSFSAAFFPSLKQLQIKYMPKLKGWWRKRGRREEEEQHLLLSPMVLPLFPCLSQATIQNCPNLTSVPLHPSVEYLSLHRVSEKLVQQQFTMMATLPTTSSSSLVPLSKLESLSIVAIEDLVSLPEEGFQSLTSLHSLDIRHCPRLISLSRGMRHLTTLDSLSIRYCSELDLSDGDEDDAMQFQGLRSLTCLRIDDIPKLVSLPVGLQHVTTLQSLRISGCENLMTLPEWIGSLASLQRLEVYSSPKLTSLPKGMRCLTALQELTISRCPNLYERCQKETGEDWPKIAHIPEVILRTWH